VSRVVHLNLDEGVVVIRCMSEKTKVFRSFTSIRSTTPFSIIPEAA
jgi:hypothetical protein